MFAKILPLSPSPSFLVHAASLTRADWLVGSLAGWMARLARLVRLVRLPPPSLPRSRCQLHDTLGWRE
ncbi:hypothetical protein E2C01_058866 [Portunus trituberculatus]|uniref:Uncharacterized protein n=1 Tax=Portunus trituberculatus TaxID=210409 RepID=A0A5B7H4B4_PORTR|nr:hypothetical protein [Portunus trituberculatus]